MWPGNPKDRFFPVYEGVYRSKDDWQAFHTLVDVVKPHKPNFTGGIRIEGKLPNIKVRSINNRLGSFDLVCARASLKTVSVAANGVLNITYRKDGLTRTKLAVMAVILAMWHLFILVWIV